MSRLTNQRYLELYDLLHGQWNTDPIPYSLISPQEQWDLHKFFQLSKDLTDIELLTHRTHVSKSDPSLPQRAGRAFKHLIEQNRYARAQPPQAVDRRAQRDAKIKVYPLVQPDIDVQKLARAMINLARYQKSKESRKN